MFLLYKLMQLTIKITIKMIYEKVRVRISVLSVLTWIDRRMSIERNTLWTIKHREMSIFRKRCTATCRTNPSISCKKKREEKSQKQLPRHRETLSQLFGLAPRVARRVSSRMIPREGWKRRIRETGIEKRGSGKGWKQEHCAIHTSVCTLRDREANASRTQPFIYLAPCPRAGCANAFSPFQRISPQIFSWRVPLPPSRFTQYFGNPL